MNIPDFRGELKLNEPLSKHTSFSIGGPCDALAAPLDRDDLVTLLKHLAGERLPYFILGGGTNLLVRDGGFRGVMITLERLNEIRIDREYRSVGGAFAVVHAGAGAGLPRLLTYAVDHGLTGLEFATGIPGTVGGAICMNAGTADGEIGDIVESVTLVSPAGETSANGKEQLGFRYRTAKIPDGHCITDIKVVLRRSEKARIKNRVKELMDKRKQFQPAGLPSAGSVFKNPQDEAAGKLIEAVGLKGRTAGNAQISEKHANFIVNRGDARAKDVLALMKIVTEKVLEARGVRLEPEITIIGEDS
ncbi:MAG TPA: hypothetical protein DCO77_00075 [Nitrospiraceae bacterium]|nr:hypothetical protein [Nitrospiraceae bacterium]